MMLYVLLLIGLESFGDLQDLGIDKSHLRRER
jgi:hypothetical protein